eukprot:6385460-Lingulodinium_polyedra.AAC.1
MPDELLPDPKEACVLWAAMGLPADCQDLVAVEWRLLWSEDTLYVSNRVVAEPDIVEDITNCFLNVLCAQAWSDSSWLTAGR